MRSLSVIAKSCMAVALIAALAVGTAATANATALTSVSVAQTKPEPSATNNVYTFTLSSQSVTALRCVGIQFDTSVNGTGAVPAGFSASSAVFGGTFMSSWSGWGAANTAGVAKVTRASGVAPAAGAGVTISLSGVTNGSAISTPEYALITTYSDQSCSTPVDNKTVSFVWTPDTNVTTIVDPTMVFTVNPLNSGNCNGAVITGTTSTPSGVALGTVDRTTRAVGAQSLQIATNAGGGASIFARVDGPMSDGAGHSLAAIGGTNASPVGFPSPGTEAFGYTVDSSLSSGDTTRFHNGGTMWSAIDTSDAEVGYTPYSATPVTSCIAYGVTIGQNTLSGFYANNVTYTAVPSY